MLIVVVAAIDYRAPSTLVAFQLTQQNVYYVLYIKQLAGVHRKHKHNLTFDHVVRCTRRARNAHCAAKSITSGRASCRVIARQRRN